MKSKARRHFAVDKLSEEGRELVVGMLSVDVGRRPPYMEIIGALRNRTGEEISLSSLSRYYHAIVLSRLEEEKEHWKTIRELQEAVKTVIREAPESDAEEIATYLVNTALVANRDKISELDMDLLLFEQRKRAQLQLQRDKLDLGHEKLDLDREKLALLKARADQAVKEIEAIAQKSNISEEFLKEVRERCYGIIEPAGNTAN